MKIAKIDAIVLNVISCWLNYHDNINIGVNIVTCFAWVKDTVSNNES
jgi:hypothetical protein